MEKIPTALELFQTGEFTKIQDAMIEFAKRHVTAALNEASKKSKIDIGKNYTVNEITLHPTSLIDTVVIKANVESILESYPLDNIK